MAWRFGVALRRSFAGRLPRLLLRRGARVGVAAGASCCSWHLHLCSFSGAAVVAVGRVTPRSVRVRSLEVLARLPPRLRASRRDSTRSRLGFDTRLTLRLALPLRLERDSPAGRRDRSLAIGALAATTSARGAAAGAEVVRVGRASEAVRTRLEPDVKRLAAFLPPLVSARRRSSAASRLEVLAMSARRMD